MAGERSAEAGLEPIEAEAVAHAERLVGLVAEGSGVGRAPRAGDQRDHAGLGVAEFGRRRPGRDRRFLDRVGADADLGARRREPQRRGSLGSPGCRPRRRRPRPDARRGWRAPADRAPPVATTPGSSASTSFTRSIGRRSMNSPCARCLVVTSSRGTRGFSRGHDLDALELDRSALQREIQGHGLAGQHPELAHLDRAVAHEDSADRRRAGREVVDEVMTAGIGHGAERGARRRDLGLGDTCAGQILDAPLDGPGGRLRAQRRRLGQNRHPSGKAQRASHTYVAPAGASVDGNGAGGTTTLPPMRSEAAATVRERLSNLCGEVPPYGTDWGMSITHGRAAGGHYVIRLHGTAAYRACVTASLPATPL